MVTRLVMSGGLLAAEVAARRLNLFCLFLMVFYPLTQSFLVMEPPVVSRRWWKFEEVA
jgi:hypothetical protein